MYPKLLHRAQTLFDYRNPASPHRLGDLFGMTCRSEWNRMIRVLRAHMSPADQSQNSRENVISEFPQSALLLVLLLSELPSMHPTGPPVGRSSVLH